MMYQTIVSDPQNLIKCVLSLHKKYFILRTHSRQIIVHVVGKFFSTTSLLNRLSYSTNIFLFLQCSCSSWSVMIGKEPQVSHCTDQFLKHSSALLGTFPPDLQEICRPWLFPVQSSVTPQTSLWQVGVWRGWGMSGNKMEKKKGYQGCPLDFNLLNLTVSPTLTQCMWSSDWPRSMRAFSLLWSSSTSRSSCRIILSAWRSATLRLISITSISSA